MLTILDYQAGNQTSVRLALEALNIPCQITADAKILEKSLGIIFPGVGAAGQAMQTLKAKSLDLVLKDLIAKEKPLLGICLGCQILLEQSQENATTMLGVLQGQVVRFANDQLFDDGSRRAVPHMGFNSVRFVKECELFADIPDTASYYFVHSYYTKPAPELILGLTSYGEEFCSVYGRKGLWGIQFHPEKSGRPGLKILENFYAFCRETQHA